MSAGSGWSWSWFPRRLRTDEAFLAADREARGVLRELYDAADKWGRGPADRMALMVALATMDGTDCRPALDRLAAAGLVVVYQVGGRSYWQLPQWETDAPYDLIRKRKGSSDYPDQVTQETGHPASPPPRTAPSGRLPGAEQAPTVRQVGAEHAPTVRPSGAEQAPSVRPPSAHQAPSGRLPGAEQAQETRRDETRRDEGSRPPPAPTGASARVREPLDPRAEQAVGLWLAHLARVAPTHCIADDVVATVARDFAPEVFARGVEAHIGDEARWWQRAPLGALRKRCEWARDRPPAPAPLAAATLPPPPTPSSQKPEKPRLTLTRPDGTSLVLRADPALVDRVAEGNASELELKALQGCKFSYLSSDGYPLPAVRGNPCPFAVAPPELQAEFLDRRREVRVEVFA